MPNRRRVTRLIGGALLGGGGMLVLQGSIASQARIGIDPSAERCFPWRVYLMRETFFPSAIKPGVLVRFDPGARMSIPGGSPVNKGRQVIKMVAAVGGDMVEIQRSTVRINSAPLVEIMKNGIDLVPEAPGLNKLVAAKLGRVEVDFERTFRVPDDHIFVVASAARSFDSRYWGTLPVSSVTALANPIF